MEKTYLTKTELAAKWSPGLIEKYFPQCSEERANPRCKQGSPMQLYDVGKIRHIESKDDFKADWRKVLKRKIASLEGAKKKREELMMYANGVQIVIPDIEKNKLTQEACDYYNWLNSIRGIAYVSATPSCDRPFLKRIIINYLRHHCTCYEEELRKFYKKVGVHEAHYILRERIDDAIIKKYDWLK